MISSGNFAPPRLTKYAGPVSGTGSIGVIAVACPITDAGGHVAGFVSNSFSVHAFCSVVKRDGSCFGRSTLTRLMFDCGPIVPGIVSFTARLAPSALLVLPDVATLNTGLKARLEQSADCNGVVTFTGTWSAGLAGSAPAPLIVFRTVAGVQLVGLIMKFGRSILTRMSRTCTTMPLMMCGIASEPFALTSTCAVVGLMSSAKRMTTVPRSNGPTFALV